jgi:hypothetical protein
LRQAENEKVFTRKFCPHDNNVVRWIFFLVVVSFELLLFGSVVIFVAIPLCGARESEVETGREGVPHARVSQS